MRLMPLRHPRPVDTSGVTGAARLDRRTKRLLQRLRPGDVAVIHHLDLDRASADALVRCRVAAVVNAAASISGRYPNLGPKVLAEAGIPLVDVPDSDVFAAVRDGAPIRIEGARIYRGDVLVAEGDLLDDDRVTALMAQARTGLGAQLEAFSLNSMEHLRRERGLLLDGVGFPEITTSMADRHVLVVTRGYDYREDLQALRGYIRERRPVLIGVDAGADALREAGYTPDLVVGDLDTVSDDTLQCGAELVAHVPRDAPPRTPGRLERLGADAVVFPATLTSEDVALLLAEAKGAQLVVAVGIHATFDEFLDKGRAGMASNFLTRLRLGSTLVDADSVSRLHSSRIAGWQLLLLVVAGLLAVALAVAVTPQGQLWVDDLGALIGIGG
jgi:uncharacterized membrane-anchored protein